MPLHMLSGKSETPGLVEQAADFEPIHIIEVEVGQPLPDVSAVEEKMGRRYQRAWCLVRLHTQPLGLVELQLEEHGVSADEYAAHIWGALSEKINEHLRQDGLPAVTGLDEKGLLSPYKPQCIEMRERFFENAPFASVIVATHDRPSQLVKCLRSLLALQYARYEIIVVDNAPSTTATAEFVQDICRHNPHVRYVREERPGTSWRYSCSRCYVEGLAKVAVARHVGAKDSLASERAYTLRILPQGVMRGLTDTLFHRDLTGLARAEAIVVGLVVTTAGYLVGSTFLRVANFKERHRLGKRLLATTARSKQVSPWKVN